MTERSLYLRNAFIGEACSVFFKRDPIKVVKARGQYLFDEKGNKFLDCISNVQHVGHGHPIVADAVAKQFAETTCNNRFLHDNIVNCAQHLKSTLGINLNTFFFANSGSEANDLAMRIAQDYTGASDVICLDHAYHGTVMSTMAISPYKFNAAGGHGKPDHVHIAPCPDVYRGKHRLSDALLYNSAKLKEMGRLYAAEVGHIIEDMKANGRKLSCFIMESLQSCGGQVIPPPGYLREVIRLVHAAGGLVIVDEVQTGFGRCGSKYWSFQLDLSDVCPDIVTLGKSMGNGFPVSAVAMNRTISNKFASRGLEYFNTYGGNPVACAAALAVMDVIRKEQLQANAADVGEYALKELRKVQAKHYGIVGDVRGVGLFIGVDLVKNRETREPASKEAEYILYRMKQKNVIISRDGPYFNVLKMKPPMCFTKENVDEVCSKLDEVLHEVEQAGEKLDIVIQKSNTSKL